jgi:hypothetical protein
MVKVINSMCNVVPNRFSFSAYGVGVSADKLYYYLVTDTAKHWPTHDPCGTNQGNQLKNIPDPHGNIYIR